MCRLKMCGRWHCFCGRMRQRWALLTGEELRYKEGLQEERLGRMQMRAGKKRAAVEEAVKEAVYALFCK